MSEKYILVGQTPVPCDDLHAWAKSMDQPRHVADEMIGNHRVSTIFLGLDHNFYHVGPPLLFETMVFCKHSGEECELDSAMDRYPTWSEAEIGHKEMVEKVKEHDRRHIDNRNSESD